MAFSKANRRTSPDHNKIFATCNQKLVDSLKTKPIGFELLQKFTLTELQNLYKTILQQPFDKEILERN